MILGRLEVSWRALGTLNTDQQRVAAMVAEAAPGWGVMVGMDDDFMGWRIRVNNGVAYGEAHIARRAVLDGYGLQHLVERCRQSAEALAESEERWRAGDGMWAQPLLQVDALGPTIGAT